ncbi:MAG: fatty acid hydroxylase [Alphaproteobacteria bacterium]|jgi:sterol desaturase/sphingolipid hydroxylase (fatty acid hydroxylase superfamily)|nr:fatty acid hydroxylase [Alphaproteobacteria bacterium]
MPTPVDILLHPVSLAVFALYAALMAWEAVAPARPLPRVRGWKTRGLASFAVFFWLSSYLPLVWDGWLARFQLVDLTGLGTAGGVAVGLLVYEVCAYAYHRAVHGSDTLWRVFHQMHHSAERLDTYGAFWFAPTDMVAWTFVGSVALVLVVGVTPTAATAILLILTLLAILQHANIRTPRWLGYLVQRPESHSIHHGRGIHAFNYADLPVIDMLFGTFRNPDAFEAETGLVDGGSSRLGALLTFRDVARDA